MLTKPYAGLHLLSFISQDLWNVSYLYEASDESPSTSSNTSEIFLIVENVELVSP